MTDIGNRTPPSSLLTDTRVMVVLRAKNAREYAPVIEALTAGGVHSIELTLSTEGVFDELDSLRARFGASVEFGIGTVTTVLQARQAIEASAAFVVTPLTDAAIIDAVVAQGLPMFPGGLTPTELFTGWSRGATAVKVFPASTVNPSYLSQLRGPFPEIQVLPSGGIHPDDVPAWIKAGAVAVSLGGPLLKDAFDGGDLTALTERTRRVIDSIAALHATP